MKQYGAPAGNPWDSDRDIVAAKARAIEDRVAEEIIEEQLESRFANACDACDAGTCSLCVGCGYELWCGGTCILKNDHDGPHMCADDGSCLLR